MTKKYLTTNKAREYIENKYQLVYKDVNYTENTTINFICHACGNCNKIFKVNFEDIFVLKILKDSHNNHLFGIYVIEN